MDANTARYLMSAFFQSAALLLSLTAVIHAFRTNTSVQYLGFGFVKNQADADKETDEVRIDTVVLSWVIVFATVTLCLSGIALYLASNNYYHRELTAYAYAFGTSTFVVTAVVMLKYIIGWSKDSWNYPKLGERNETKKLVMGRNDNDININIPLWQCPNCKGVFCGLQEPSDHKCDQLIKKVSE